MLEQFQFEARQLNQGYSLFLWRNNKMILLKRFFDGAKTTYTSLLILRKTLHGCSLLENAGAYSPEQPFTTINALPKSFVSPTETCILNGHGYNTFHLSEKYLLDVMFKLICYFLRAFRTYSR